MPTPQQIAAAAEVAKQLEQAAHGQRQAILAEACARLGCSKATLYGWMGEHRHTGRKRRSDAGAVELSRDEAQLIAATMSEGYRQTGRTIVTLRTAVTRLREAGLIVAGVVDEATGEIRPLSESAIARALRSYQIHPQQMRQPTPHQPKRTLHPNHEWQIDASVCVVYYLPDGGSGLAPMDQAVHYKNKPENLRAVEQFRVIRYVGTDHTSGVIRWRYYPHSESGAHTVDFLAWMMAPKNDAADPFHGAPKQVLVDPGATASGTVRRFCARCEIDLIVSKAHNPRAKGQVEKANHQVEQVFEGGLRFIRKRLTDFAALNVLAERFQKYWNATETHSRHGLTRFDAWMRIRPEELRITAPYETLLTLASEQPKACKVRGDLTVHYRGKVWRVAEVPGVCIGAKLDVHWSPFAGEGGQAMAILDGPDGHEVHFRLPEVERDDWGFDVEAPVSGAEYDRQKDTPIDTNRKAISRLASGQATDAADELARKRKDFQPLESVEGGFNPYHAAETAEPRNYLPRRGTDHPLRAPDLQAPPLTHIAAAKLLRAELEAVGGAWSPQRYAWLVERYPDGVPESAISGLLAELAAPTEHPAQAAGLRLVK